MIRSVDLDKQGNPDYPDIVYYNLDIINGKTKDEGIGSNPLARFNETRDTPIIKDSSKYYFSIVRFTMNGSDKTLPMFIPRIRLGQSNPNLTIYEIGLQVDISYDFPDGVGSQQFTLTTADGAGNPEAAPILYEPQNVNLREPQGTIETQDLESEYYYVYNYDHWIRLVNKTFLAAWENLNTEFRKRQATLGVSPGNVVDLTTTEPELYYNRNTERFSIYADTNGFGGDARLSKDTNSDESFRIYFNSNMYGLFSFFPHNYLGGDNQSSNGIGKGFATEILVENQLGLNIYRPVRPDITSVSNLPSYYVVDQDFTSTSTLWSPVASLVFVSTLIPVQNEQTGQPVKFGAGNVQIPVGTQSAFQPIVTDIALANTNANAYNEFVSYIPSAEYRISTLSNSPQEVRNIDIQVFWKSRLDGNLIPIELFNLSNIQVKIMFRRRDYGAY